jgi:predicted ATP-binding protein involved in virulence
MKILESVHITGLWGSKTLAVKFSRDVNFLIGPNGSGKTTVINLIAAALTADLATLDRLSFEEIQIALQDPDRDDPSFVTVTKAFDKNRRFPVVRYRFQDRKGERDYGAEDIERFSAPANRRFITRRLQGALMEELSTSVRVRWLSIHRSPSKSDDEEEDSYESTVDQKLDELTHELIKFFSKLSSAGEAESERFQKTVFTSLLYGRTSEWDLIRSVAQLNLEQEKAALQEIFRKFRVPEASFSEQLTEHFSLVSAGLAGGTALSTQALIALVSMRSIHSVVMNWKATVDRQQDISKPKEHFLALLNDMMPTKQFTVNDKNELQVAVGTTKIIPNQLSSGEKQMLILLGEALLQEKGNWLYIADEPELSLHVKWQEVLINNLRQINPEAQVIFATHSPDIVGAHEEGVLNMEDLLR